MKKILCSTLLFSFSSLFAGFLPPVLDGTSVSPCVASALHYGEILTAQSTLIIRG